jgi:hypothetical protein
MILESYSTIILDGIISHFGILPYGDIAGIEVDTRLSRNGFPRSMA